MRQLLTLLVLALSGCTAVVVESPLGTAVPTGVSQSFSGVWTFSPGKSVALDLNANGELVASWDDDGTPRRSAVRFTEIENVPLVWIELEPQRWTVARLLQSDDNALSLLAPDLEEIESQIAAGALAGGESGKYLLLEETSLAAALATKQFWTLDGAWPLIRLHSPAEAAP